MQMRIQLSTLKDLTTAEYFHKVKGLADAVAYIGKLLGDDEILSYMFVGLGLEYEHLVASITAREETVSLNSFYCFFLSSELRMETASLGW